MASPAGRSDDRSADAVGSAGELERAGSRCQARACGATRLPAEPARIRCASAARPARAPRCRPQPQPTGTAGLAQALESGDLDIAFLSALPADCPDLAIHVLARSRLRLGVPADHELASRPSISLAETADLRFVELRPGSANSTVVDREFRARGLRRAVHIETSDIDESAALVRNGLSVAFLSEQLVEGVDSIRVLPLADVDLVQPVSVATSRVRPTRAATRAPEALARGTTGTHTTTPTPPNGRAGVE